MSKPRSLVLGLIILLVIAGLVYNNRPQSLSVVTVKVDRATVEQTVSNTRVGSVIACNRSRLSPAIGGQVAKLYVKEGDVVKQGALLLALWNLDRKANLQQVEAALRIAGHELERVCISADNDTREAKRTEQLVKRQLASVELADQLQSRASASRAACASANAQQEQAQAAVAMAQAALEQTLLRAPFAGIVAQVTGEVGEFTTPSPPGVATPPAIDLLTNDCHYVTAPIDEVDAAVLSVGLPVRVTLDAFKGQLFQGRVRRVAAYVEDREKQARTVNVDVDFSDALDIALIAGYSADIEIVIAVHENVLRIPTEALLEADLNGQRQVLVLNAQGLLEARAVTVGISNWRYSEIISGLTVGEQVVMSLGRKDIVAGIAAVSSDQHE